MHSGHQSLQLGCEKSIGQYIKWNQVDHLSTDTVNNSNNSFF